MIRLFKKKSKADKLQSEYERLMERSFKLSKVNRTESDRIYAEAQLILEKIEKAD